MPRNWEEEKRGAHPLVAEMGEAEWRVPSDRATCASQNTGPAQPPQFRVKVENKKYLRLFLDALPITTFWERVVVKQSKRYGQHKVCISVLYIYKVCVLMRVLICSHTITGNLGHNTTSVRCKPHHRGKLPAPRCRTHNAWTG